MFDTHGDSSPGSNSDQLRVLLDALSLSHLGRAARMLDIDRTALSRVINGHRNFNGINALTTNMCAAALNRGAHPSDILHALAANVATNDKVALMLDLSGLGEQ